jgi:hypothetical protein
MRRRIGVSETRGSSTTVKGEVVVDSDRRPAQGAVVLFEASGRLAGML